MYAVSPLAASQGISLPSLIVELAGPSASGKSTLARAIVAVLHSARLAASARPVETASAVRRFLPPAVVRATKITRAIPFLVGGLAEGSEAERLMAVLPAPSPLWRLRYRRYLAELTLRVRREREKGGVTVLDQGFVTAVGTLASLGRGVDHDALAQALQIVPRPDLVIAVQTPRDVIASRLRTRLDAQSVAERLFELGISQTLRQIEVFEALDQLFDSNGFPVLRVACPDRKGLGVVAGAVANRIETLWRETST